MVKLSKALKVSPEEILGRGRLDVEKKRLPSPKLLRRLERIQALPRSKQKTLLDWLDAYLDRQGNGSR